MNDSLAFVTRLKELCDKAEKCSSEEFFSIVEEIKTLAEDTIESLCFGESKAEDLAFVGDDGIK